MKTKLFLLCLIIPAFMLVSSCYKQAETDKPLITLKGDNPYILILGTPYKDPGATAWDDKDGDLSVSIIVDSVINVNHTGTYNVDYTVFDAAGNKATATRTLIVINEADPLKGSYYVVDTITGLNSGKRTYAVNAYASQTYNNKIFMDNFGGLGSGVSVYGIINGNTITIPAQNPANMLSPGTISGTGFTSNDTILGVIYNINYIPNGTGSDDGVAVFTKL